MATRNFNLTERNSAFIEECIASGEYANASEVARAALALLEHQRAERALRLERLKREVRIGLDQLERGEYIEVADKDLEAYAQSLRPKRDPA